MLTSRAEAVDKDKDEGKGAAKDKMHQCSFNHSQQVADEGKGAAEDKMHQCSFTRSQQVANEGKISPRLFNRIPVTTGYCILQESL